MRPDIESNWISQSFVLFTKILLLAKIFFKILTQNHQEFVFDTSASEH